MAKRRDPGTPLFDGPDPGGGTEPPGPPPIETVELTDAAQARYLNYALSVITARALPGRARRAQAGAAAHPLHDVGAAAERDRQAPQVGQGGGRRHGELPPPRRHRPLRHAGTHGPALRPALSARRRTRQLRVARRRRRRRHALHRVPPRPPERGAARRDRPRDGPVPAQLRRHPHRAGGAAGAAAQPPRQRRHRHRRRHGHQHPPAPRRRGVRSAARAARRPRAEQRPALPVHQGAGLPHRGADSEHAGRAGADLRDGQRGGPRPRHLGGGAEDPRQPDPLRHEHPLRGEQGPARGARSPRSSSPANSRPCST